MNRDIPVIAYLHNDIVYCRACLSRTSDSPNSTLCNKLTIHECCVKGNGDLKPEWEFNNTIHKIVVTINDCIAGELCKDKANCPCLLTTQTIYKRKNGM